MPWSEIRHVVSKLNCPCPCLFLLEHFCAIDGQVAPRDLKFSPEAHISSFPVFSIKPILPSQLSLLTAGFRTDGRRLTRAVLAQLVINSCHYMPLISIDLHSITAIYSMSNCFASTIRSVVAAGVYLWPANRALLSFSSKAEHV